MIRASVKISTTSGHLQGDQCLQQVAGALSGCCMRPLDFAGRYGGEEFVVMWFDAEPAEVRPLPPG
ncbi:MAG: GGDEF domain-containing protein [Gammaproteobacteria bacterium]